MSIRRKEILKWAISGVAFLSALAVTSGCQSTGSAPGRETAALAEPPHAQADAGEAAPTDMAPIPVLGSIRGAAPINAFGEFGAISDGPAVGHTASAFQQHTFATDGQDIDVSVDPTGKWLVYSSTRHSEHPDIYLQKVDGVSVVQLTDDPADDAFPTFSPDGKTIAFCSTRNGSWDIYTMDVDGRHVVQVTNGRAQEFHPSFSPDGTRLVYCSLGSRSQDWELWVVNLTTGEKRMIGYGLFPVWSPQKGVDRIAFQRASQRGNRWFSLWTLDLVDGEARRVTEVAASAEAAIVSPAWSPDGQKLAYATIRPSLAATSAKPVELKEIWTVNADGANRRRLTDGIGSNLSPVWGVDNRVYFVSDRSGAQSIWSVRVDSMSPAVASGASEPAEAHAAASPNAGKPQATSAATGKQATAQPAAPADPAAAVGSADVHEVAH